MADKLKEGVKNLIFQYFLCDILDEPLTDDMRQNIIDTFTYAYDHHIERLDLSSQIDESAMSALRNRIIKRNKSNYNPFPIRFGSLKPKLMEEAHCNNMSLHGYVTFLLKKRDDINKGVFDQMCIPRLSKYYKKKRHNKQYINQLVIFN